MTMHDYAKKSQFKDMIQAMCNGEVNGSDMYYVYAYLAKEKGYDDVYEAIMANAAEDAYHGGRYGAMLGKEKEQEEEFWKALVGFYKLEAGAETKLQKMADQAREAGEEALAREIEASIEEENEHTRRLAKVFDAHGIKY